MVPKHTGPANGNLDFRKGEEEGFTSGQDFQGSVDWSRRMVNYISSLSSTLFRFFADTPLQMSREEWILTFFCMLLFGFVCLRSCTQRSN